MSRDISSSRVFGTATAVKTVIYGITYAFATKEATNSLLWTYISNLPAVEPMMFGVFLLVVGLAGIFAYATKSPFWVKRTGEIQTLCYIFMFVTYVFGGAHLAAIGVAGYLVFMSFVSSYFYYNRLMEDQLTSNAE